MTFHILIITVSDRAFQGVYQDLSGPAMEETLQKTLSDCTLSIEKKIVPDCEKKLSQAIMEGLNADFILTTGGTGLSPRDITPDVCKKIAPKEIPGIAEFLRIRSLEETPNAIFSRGYAGIIEQTIIINFPGSVRGAVFCTNLIAPLLKHAKKMLQGNGH